MKKGSSDVSRRVSAACFLVTAAVLAPQAICAAEFEGGIQTGVSNTDNVFLTSSPNMEDDTILRAAPYFRVTYESPGIDAVANYKYDWYRYTDLKNESSFHTYDASVTGKLLEETLTMQVGASRRQVIKNPDDGIPAGRLPLTNNLSDNDLVFATPRLKKSFGTAITLDASYRYENSRYGDSTIQDNENHDARVSLENYQRGTGPTWALKYEQRETDYEVSSAWEYEKATAELGLWISDTTRLFASGGKESQWDDLIDRSAKDPFWEAGFAINTGPKLSAEFAAGERSFGTSWRGELDLAFQRGITRLSYAETPTTIGFGRDRRPVDQFDAADPSDFLTTPGRSESYILNRLQWNLDLEFRRTTIGFLVYDEERSGRIDPNGTPLDDQDQRGVSGRLSWAVGPRTELVASGSLANRKYSAGAESDFRQVSLQADYRVGPNSAVSLIYEYSEEQPGSGAAATRDYVANVVSLLFSYEFFGT